MNEFLLLLSLCVTYGGVVVAYWVFGVSGFFAFGVFATLVANIEVNFLLNAFGITQTLGNVLFASTFLITDALSEIRGKQEAKKFVALSLFFSVLFLIFTQFWLHYIPLEDATGETFSKLFSQTPRIIITSLLVFAIASYLDVWLYHRWWNWSKKLCSDSQKYLWLRNNGSTLISQGVNTILFSIGAFYGVYDWSVILQIIISSYAIFVCLALLDTFALYGIVYLAKQKKDYDLKKL